MGGEPSGALGVGVRAAPPFPPLPTSLRARGASRKRACGGPRPAREASEENCRPGLAPNGLRSETAGWNAELFFDSGRAGASQGGTDISVPFPAPPPPLIFISRAPVCRGISKVWGRPRGVTPESRRRVTDRRCYFLKHQGTRTSTLWPHRPNLHPVL